MNNFKTFKYNNLEHNINMNTITSFLPPYCKRSSVGIPPYCKISSVGKEWIQTLSLINGNTLDFFYPTEEEAITLYNFLKDTGLPNEITNKEAKEVIYNANYCYKQFSGVMTGLKHLTENNRIELCDNFIKALNNIRSGDLRDC